MSDVDSVRELASSARLIFTRLFQYCPEVTSTRGTCAYASFMAKEMISKFSDYECHARGGDGKNDGGYFDEKGNGHGHYWVEVVTPTGNFVVDLTADQFDGAEVVVEPAEGNQKYVAGNQQLVESHFAEIAISITGPLAT